MMTEQSVQHACGGISRKGMVSFVQENRQVEQRSGYCADLTRDVIKERMLCNVAKGI